MKMKERPNEQALEANFEFDALRAANNYRQALIREFSPTLQGRVIEIGAGIGQITELLRGLPSICHLLSIEPDPDFCQQFRTSHPELPLLEGTVESVREEKIWDGILSINVLEHIRDDEHELQTYHDLLERRKGALHLFVPARQEIYSPIDKDFGHHRRYSKQELKSKLTAAGFKIERLNYFNSIGYFAWWFNFIFLKKRKFDAASVKLYDRIIFPLVYGFESKVTPPPFGQSLIAVARA
jgi:SAM-dependent methyltransferase